VLLFHNKSTIGFYEVRFKDKIGGSSCPEGGRMTKSFKTDELKPGPI